MTAGIVNTHMFDDVTDDLLNNASYLQVGTGSGQSVGDGELASPVVTDRIEMTANQTTVDETNDTWNLVATYTAPSDITISEAGVFDNQSGSNMIAYSDAFASIALAAGDAIVFSVNVTFARG